MAINSLQLFLGQIQTNPGVLKMRVLQIVFDILMVHKSEFLGQNSANVGVPAFLSATSLTYAIGPSNY